jgi:predicted membrane metal-binding protein
VAVTQIQYIKKQYLGKIGDPESVNAFQWCKARLALEHPDALTFVNRFEADSKFFRSFVPVILGMLCLSLYLIIFSPREPRHWWWSLGLLVLFFLAFWRYMEQRFKATQQAYWFILTLEANNLARNREQGRHD